MVQIKIKSEAHLEALDALRELFANAMDEGIDPDIFMESCLCFALAYHLEFTDSDSLHQFIEHAKTEMLTPAKNEEIICH
jgi:hypothetical protein